MNAQTHCLHGHEFNAANTYVRPEGWRICRACMRERWRRKHGMEQRYTEAGYIAGRGTNDSTNLRRERK